MLWYNIEGRGMMCVYKNVLVVGLGRHLEEGNIIVFSSSFFVKFF